MGKSAKIARKLISPATKGTNKPSNKAIAKRVFDGSLQSFVRSLSRSFRRTALDQLAQIAKSIAENPALEKDDKVAALYEALDNIAGMINALSYPTPMNGKRPKLWNDWKRKIEEKKRKHIPLDEFEFSGNPFLYAGRFYGNGCPIAIIRRLDPQLRAALYSWEAKYGNETEFVFPNERTEHDRILAIIGMDPDFDTLPASKVLQARTILTMKSFLRTRKLRRQNPSSG